MEKKIPVLDTLCLNASKSIKKHLYQNEMVYFSCKITKFNQKSKMSRILMNTNFRLFNIKKSIMGKRQISRATLFSKIAGIVVSTTTNQFTFLVPSEYDFWYSSPGS